MKKNQIKPLENNFPTRNIFLFKFLPTTAITYKTCARAKKNDHAASVSPICFCFPGRSIIKSARPIPRRVITAIIHGRKTSEKTGKNFPPLCAHRNNERTARARWNSPASGKRTNAQRAIAHRLLLAHGGIIGTCPRKLQRASVYITRGIKLRQDRPSAAESPSDDLHNEFAPGAFLIRKLYLGPGAYQGARSSDARRALRRYTRAQSPSGASRQIDRTARRIDVSVAVILHDGPINYAWPRARAPISFSIYLRACRQQQRLVGMRSRRVLGCVCGREIWYARARARSRTPASLCF